MGIDISSEWKNGIAEDVSTHPASFHIKFLIIPAV
jgi:hypothetical protein